MNLFNNKVNIVADYFVDTRVDLLIPGIPVSEFLELKHLGHPHRL
jgi:hypothetical protein